MERMIIPSDARHVLCARPECEKNTPITLLDQAYIHQRGFSVVQCECGKNFEVEIEKTVK